MPWSPPHPVVELMPQESHASPDPIHAALRGAGVMTRRGFLAFGTLAAVGCASSTTVSRLPEPVLRSVNKPAVCPPVLPAKPRDFDFLHARQDWARGTSVPSLMNPMLPPRWITLHHDGMSPFQARDQYSAAARIEVIRVSHRNKGWGDIGYHYVIDRGGRVWEGRDLKWQGAHVKDHNEGNIGICCLGNFDEQSPSDAQLDAVERMVSCLMERHRVPVNRVRSHQEWQGARTACPGRSLQREFVSMRRQELSRVTAPASGTAWT
jgi:N-acetylmuramoyl-L-alanine amidase